MTWGLFSAKQSPEPMLALSIRPLGTNYDDILTKMKTFAFKKMQLKILSAICQLFGSGLKELKNQLRIRHRAPLLVKWMLFGVQSSRFSQQHLKHKTWRDEYTDWSLISNNAWHTVAILAGCRGIYRANPHGKYMISVSIHWKIIVKDCFL